MDGFFDGFVVLKSPRFSVSLAEKDDIKLVFCPFS